MLLLCASAVTTRGAEPLPTIEKKTQGLEKRSGLLDLYVDAQRGTVWLQLPAPAEGSDEIGRYLYYEALVRGLGSNPVGLDRSQLGSTRLVAVRRVGGRILFERLNTQYRALSDDEEERRAVEQSFATSVLWAGALAAEDADGSVLVDFTSFIVRDAHRVAATLESRGQGSWSLDQSRSVPELENCLAFPENLALEAVLTFQGGKPGSEVRATAPTAEAVTLVLHHSILKLPDAGYSPRRHDPRVGCFAVTFTDYAAPLDAPLDTRWIVRHRLRKTEPSAARSRVEDPIVYYVDRGVPEPVRSALIDGARWWAQAFEQAGFIDAFRVELLPQGAHPLDARYNVINWVHRATRGWSYGGGVIDPRTGEFVKGHVLLGSLRVRQDRLLFEGLAGTEHTGSGRADDPVELALARIRQLSAHEVGHTLGIAHNFAASTYGRASVMDYPAPLVRVTPEEELDFSETYAVGVGAWDIEAIRYAYTEFAPGTDEADGLEEIVQDGLRRGLRFLSDADARPGGAAQPLGNLWDNGVQAETELARLLEVRRVALERFGERNVAQGQPLALLEEVLATVYFMHRYQVDAAAKVLGGVDYRYAMRGDGQGGAFPIAAERQSDAMGALLACLAPEALDISDDVIEVVLPRPFGYGRNREQLASATMPLFDPLGAAATAADMVLRALLQPQRCARLVDQNRRNADLPGLEMLLASIRQALVGAQKMSPRLAEIQRVVQRVGVDALLDLASNDATPPHVRSRLEWELMELRNGLQRKRGREGAERAHRASLLADVTRHLDRLGNEVEPMGAADPPPGSPIGAAASDLGVERAPHPLPPHWGGCSWGP
jgi:hypothetical protein